ncbi:hypothetical protein [Sandaracinobacteroides hominis]|nr:hypothetical protein [Sandaracinobacteroides hominis]
MPEGKSLFDRVEIEPKATSAVGILVVGVVLGLLLAAAVAVAKTR